VQYLAIRYTQRACQRRGVLSLQSQRQLQQRPAESFNGLLKTELIRPHGPWQGLDDLELSTLDYID
jgi:putative transposase